MTDTCSDSASFWQIGVPFSGLIHALRCYLDFLQDDRVDRLLDSTRFGDVQLLFFDEISLLVLFDGGDIDVIGQECQ